MPVKSLKQAKFLFAETPRYNKAMVEGKSSELEEITKVLSYKDQEWKEQRKDLWKKKV